MIPTPISRRTFIQSSAALAASTLVAAEKGKLIAYVGTYTSPLQNNWLYVITTNKKQSFHAVLMWFYAADGLTGLQLASEGLPYIYPPHFFKRFRERSGEGDTDAVQNLRNYFFRNPLPCTMYMTSST